MISSRLTIKSQTTVPRAVRAALGAKPGDHLGWVVDGDEVRVRRQPVDDAPVENPYAAFTEWADELDSVYDNL